MTARFAQRVDDVAIRFMRLAVRQRLERALEVVESGVDSSQEWIGLNFSVQGFGMLRFHPFNERDFRVHVWHDALRYDGVDDIHDHPWDFESVILAGEVDDWDVSVFDGANGSTRGSGSWTLAEITCGERPEDVGTRNERRVEMQEFRQTVREGWVYRRVAESFHRTSAKSGTVTLVQRPKRWDRHPDHARVVFPSNRKWQSAEPKPATSEHLRRSLPQAIEFLTRAIEGKI